MEKQPVDPLWLLVMLGPLGSLAGCAALLRSKQQLNRRAFWTAILNSGLMAIGIASLMYWKFHQTEQALSMIIGVSILAGLGGTAFVDFSLAVLMRAIEKKAEK